MKKALFIDCCIRRNKSRTYQLADEFIKELKDYEIKHLVLEDEDLKPLTKEFFSSRQELLDKGDLNHPRFKYAYEFKEADLIIIAAPFWDLSFPAILKIYFENISVDSITFDSTEKGLLGLCKANNLVYLTTRGGIFKDSPLEQATPYIKSMCNFFGIENFNYIAADGMDIQGYDSKSSLNEAIKKAKELAKTL